MPVSMRGISVVALGFLLIALVRCSPQQLVTPGTGSETVIGHVWNEDGSPAVETVVALRPSAFDPVSSRTLSDCGIDTTDSQGRYKIVIDSPKAKNYTLQAVNLRLRTRTVVSDIDFSALRDSVMVEAAWLHTTGSIKVILSDSSISGYGYTFIPGTTYLTLMQNRNAIIDSVPAETIAHVYYTEISEGSPTRSLAEAVDVKPGIATIVAYCGAANSMNFFLNTTPAGADVTETVYGFPVLIRLSSVNFNFSGRTDGSDIRFTKADNTPLPFEIERWDAGTQHAEIWVKVDTVHGNDSSHFVVMYWGEPATAIPRNNARVFDTSGGFRGVWHLAEEAAGIGTKGLYKDATGRNNGDDFISATDQSGIIGNGHGFDGIDDYILVNAPVTNFLKGDVTIALWVGIHDSGGAILSKLDTSVKWNMGESSLYFGNGTDAHLSPLGASGGRLSNGARPSFVGYSDDYAIAGQSVAADGWHYLVYTWKWRGDSIGTPRYFIDGKEAALSRDSLVIRYDENLNAVLRIGQPNNNESVAYFKGLMDELEISAVARSAGWIKLCYMNQGAENRLLK